MKAKINQVVQAMEVLLSRQQRNYVNSRTYLGYSKLEMVRRLVKKGIEADKLERSNYSAQ